MRLAAVTLLAALGLSASALSAKAAPIAPLPVAPQASAIVEVAGGCGRAFHRNRWGDCVPNRHGYYRPHRYGYYRPHPYWTPHWPGYYGDGHQPWNQPSPSDHVANRLNRQVLRGMY
jgi:hypothetical protein